MNIGNNNIVVGQRFDTGKKWIDAAGAGHVIYRKALTVGAFPNATTKNVAHGEALNVATKYTDVVALWASNGTIMKTKNSVGVSAEITASNVVVGSTADLSLFLNGIVVIEFCL